MTPTIIGVIIVCCAGPAVGALFLFADAILGLRHRGETAEGHADDIPGADDACALTRPLPQPLEHVPPIRHPGLWAREEEMAGTPAARLAHQLATRSNQ